MRKCLIILLLAPALVLAQTIYKHVDEEGNVIYSDEPMTDDAQAMDLPPLSVVESNRVAPLSDRLPRGEAAPAAEGEPSMNYDRFEFLAPKPDEAMWGTGNRLLAVVAVDPVLAPGHRIRYSIDGRSIVESENTRIQLTDVDRGTHRLAAEIVDSEDRVHSSAAVTFHMKQPSVINPANPAPQAPTANQARPANRQNGGGG